MLYDISLGLMPFNAYHSYLNYLDSPKWNKQFLCFCFSHELMAAILEREACVTDLFKQCS